MIYEDTQTLEKKEKKDAENLLWRRGEVFSGQRWSGADFIVKGFYHSEPGFHKPFETVQFG